MKYVLLGTLSPGFLTKQEKRTSNARAKLKELGIRLESVHYTQGQYDFVDIVERFRVQLLTDQAGPLRRASILSCNRAKASSPGISLTLPLLTSS